MVDTKQTKVVESLQSTSNNSQIFLLGILYMVTIPDISNMWIMINYSFTDNLWPDSQVNRIAQLTRSAVNCTLIFLLNLFVWICIFSATITNSKQCSNWCTNEHLQISLKLTLTRPLTLTQQMVNETGDWASH